MLIDSHCHIPDPKYEKSVAEIVQESDSAGVTSLITIGTSLANSQEVLDTAKLYPNMYCSIGVYPHEDLQISLAQIEKDLSQLILLGSKKLVGIGECGLDLPKQPPEDYPVRSLSSQIELLSLQLDLAVKYNLPVIIHNRNADEHILSILGRYRNSGLRGVIHCFSSDWLFGQKVLELGFFLSFSGLITYPKVASGVIDTVKYVPSDRFLIETDAPFLPPQGYRGTTNYPKYVKIIAEKIAEIRNSPFEEISQQTFDNTCSLFLI